jgi:hypothetical protein
MGMVSCQPLLRAAALMTTRIQIELLMRKLQGHMRRYVTDACILMAAFMETKKCAVLQFEFNAGAALLFI